MVALLTPERWLMASIVAPGKPWSCRISAAAASTASWARTLRGLSSFGPPGAAGAPGSADADRLARIPVLNHELNDRFA
jgi:hypothetical protein